ncbi:D-alanine--D-alanine ligase [hydrothermal vent metagenome]|uniref:D-alanine--D-alanine ligase n=1 Tax=hydrothermal vent metagenome TaxID=652676 RepID=A0A3B0VCS3_9ZZZZ
MAQCKGLITDFKGRRIGVLMGGLSEEREISLKSGRAVLEALRSRGYNAVAIDVGSEAAALLRKEAVEVAFIALHGLYGEDGAVQGLLEIMGIPYTGSGVLASAAAMDKVAGKIFFERYGIPTPAYSVLRDGENKLPEGLGLPLIVKPASHGSTIGIGVADTSAEFQRAVGEAYAYEDTLVVERFISGREVTISILDGTPLPIVEIITRARIYDFRSKYEKGMTEFVVPADLEESIAEGASEAALAAYKALGCSGAARVDIVLDEAGRPFVLEANTVPGMTGTSLLPMAARAAGMDYEALVEEILLGARLHKDRGAPPADTVEAGKEHA